jgi:hypothetical protein
LETNIVIYPQIKKIRVRTWEERFSQQTIDAEKRARRALRVGDVEKAQKVAVRAQKRAKCSGFVSSSIVLSHLDFS